MAKNPEFLTFGFEPSANSKIQSFKNRTDFAPDPLREATQRSKVPENFWRNMNERLQNPNESAAETLPSAACAAKKRRSFKSAEFFHAKAASEGEMSERVPKT